MKIKFAAGIGACSMEMTVNASQPLNSFPKVLALLMKRYADMSVGYKFEILEVTSEERKAFIAETVKEYTALK